MNVKPGTKTTEFLLTLAVDIGIVATGVQGSLPPKWAAICGVVANAAYAISRGLTKAGSS